MRTACFIPIKRNSERVVGKNFRVLNGKKLYMYIIEHVIEADCFDDIYIDSNSDEIKEYTLSKGLNYIERREELTRNTANGNDLLLYHHGLHPEYDYYFQLFATAPYLLPKTIRACCDALVLSNEYDSCMTVLEHKGFYWMGNQPINYRPVVLPRSQDLEPVIEESTGMYGISREALERYRCRIGANPYMQKISKFEAVDINTEEDFKMAEYIGRYYWNYGE